MRVVLDTNILIRANPKARGPVSDLFVDDAFALIEGHSLMRMQTVRSAPHKKSFTASRTGETGVL